MGGGRTGVLEVTGFTSGRGPLAGLVLTSSLVEFEVLKFLKASVEKTSNLLAVEMLGAIDHVLFGLELTMLSVRCLLGSDVT